MREVISSLDHHDLHRIVLALKRVQKNPNPTGICNQLALEIDLGLVSFGGLSIVRHYLRANKLDCSRSYPVKGGEVAYYRRPRYMTLRFYFWSRLSSYGRARRKFLKEMIKFYEELSIKKQSEY